MRAYRVWKHGAPSILRVDVLPDLEPAPDEVVVDVKAVAINFPDLLTISGDYQVLPPKPFTPGKDLAGLVRAVGSNVTTFVPGDKIMAQLEYGAFAEQAVVTSKRAYKIPDAMQFEVAAAMGLVYQTAYFALVERGGVKAGDFVLVGGAAGGVGHAAVQIAKSLGAIVLAGVRNDQEAASVRDVGVDTIIDLSAPNLRDNLREQVAAATGGHGADIVIDPLGSEFFAGAIRSMAWCGRLIVIGFAAGEIPTVKINYLLLKNISVSGLQWSDYRDRTPEHVAAVWSEIFRLWNEDALHPRIQQILPFDKLPDAVNLLAEGHVHGKIVVSIP